MQVRRHDQRYQGSLTRVSDQLCLQFSGVLELLAVMERLTTNEHRADQGGGEPE